MMTQVLSQMLLLVSIPLRRFTDDFLKLRDEVALRGIVQMRGDLRQPQLRVLQQETGFVDLFPLHIINNADCKFIGYYLYCPILDYLQLCGNKTT